MVLLDAGGKRKHIFFLDLAKDYKALHKSGYEDLLEVIS